MPRRERKRGLLLLLPSSLKNPKSQVAKGGGDPFSNSHQLISTWDFIVSHRSLNNIGINWTCHVVWKLPLVWPLFDPTVDVDVCPPLILNILSPLLISFSSFCLLFIFTFAALLFSRRHFFVFTQEEEEEEEEEDISCLLARLRLLFPASSFAFSSLFSMSSPSVHVFAEW